MAECIECGYEIPERNFEIGELIECPGCGMELEIVGVNPTRLAPAPEIEEDWGE